MLSHLLLVVGCGQSLWHQAICGGDDLGGLLMELRQGSRLMMEWGSPVPLQQQQEPGRLSGTLRWAGRDAPLGGNRRAQQQQVRGREWSCSN